MSRPILLRPRLSEKVYAQSETLNTYVFDVSKQINKLEIVQAVKKQYQVVPVSVRISTSRGKNQRSVRKAGRSVRKFKRSDVRKAYVTLKPSDKLPIFAAVEEPATKKTQKDKK